MTDGPRDFSEAVHSHYTPAPGPLLDGPGCLVARIHLGESERDKIGAEDVFEAVAELLARNGVDMEHAFVESWRRQENGIPVAICSGRKPEGAG